MAIMWRAEDFDPRSWMDIENPTVGLCSHIRKLRTRVATLLPEEMETETYIQTCAVLEDLIADYVAGYNETMAEDIQKTGMTICLGYGGLTEFFALRENFIPAKSLWDDVQGLTPAILFAVFAREKLSEATSLLLAYRETSLPDCSLFGEASTTRYALAGDAVAEAMEAIHYADRLNATPNTGSGNDQFKSNIPPEIANEASSSEHSRTGGTINIVFRHSMPPLTSLGQQKGNYITKAGAQGATQVENPEIGPSAKPEAEAVELENCFIEQEDEWYTCFEGKEVWFRKAGEKSLKGFQYIHYLLGMNGKTCNPIEMVSYRNNNDDDNQANDDDDDDDNKKEYQTSQKGARNGEAPQRGYVRKLKRDSKTIPTNLMIDDEAKKEIIKNKRALEREIKEIESHKPIRPGDAQQLEELESELEKLENYLRQVLKLKGGVRSFSYDRRKCGRAVGMRIKCTLDAIRSDAPALHAHLSESLINPAGINPHYRDHRTVHWRLYMKKAETVSSF